MKNRVWCCFGIKHDSCAWHHYCSERKKKSFKVILEMESLHTFEPFHSPKPSTPRMPTGSVLGSLRAFAVTRTTGPYPSAAATGTN